MRAALWRKPHADLLEIAVQGIRGAGWFGERHIGIGPQQIERVARQAYALVPGLPDERVQRQILARAPRDERIARLAIDMDLPVHVTERREIVGAVDGRPGQA